MKHQKKKRELGRPEGQRKALLKTLLGSLILNEKIKTTEAKAKEAKNAIDKLISKAKKTQEKDKKIAVLRNLNKFIPKIAVKKLLSEEFLKKFSQRNSGYARIIKLERRKSDGAKMSIIEFV
jgi:large subunit ribosomal protein L17